MFRLQHKLHKHEQWYYRGVYLIDKVVHQQVMLYDSSR